MEEQHFKPGIELSDTISSFYYFNTEISSKKTIKCVSPNLEMMVILNFGNPFKVSFNEELLKEKTIENFAVAGPLRNRFNYEVLPASNVLVLNFILDGFYRLFEINLSGFTGDLLLHEKDLSHLSPSFENLWNMLKPITKLPVRIKKLNEYLISTIKKSEAKELGLIYKEKTSSQLLINTLYKVPAITDISNRTVQINFKKYFGYSVKEKVRYERFKNVVSYLLSPGIASVKWAAIINRFGYYDQSHLYKDFKKFLSTNPQKFVKNTNDFCVPEF